MGTPLLASANHPGQELESHLILASEFLATQIGLLTRFTVPLRLRPELEQAFDHAHRLAQRQTEHGLEGQAKLDSSIREQWCAAALAAGKP